MLLHIIIVTEVCLLASRGEAVHL